MKKIYNKPEINMESGLTADLICASQVGAVGGNADLGYSGAGDGTAAGGGPARGRSFDNWSDESGSWEE